jgi:hypothetical protein
MISSIPKAPASPAPVVTALSPPLQPTDVARLHRPDEQLPLPRLGVIGRRNSSELD